MNEQTKKQLNPSIVLLIGIVIMAVCIWTAKYILVTALVLPFLGAYLTARLTPSWSAVYYVAAGALCYVFLGELWLPALVMLLLSGLLTAIAVKKKLFAYESVILSCAGWILAILVVIGWCHLKLHTDPLSLITEKFRVLLQENDSAAVFGYMWLRIGELRAAATPAAAMKIYQDMMVALGTESMDFLRSFAMTENALTQYNNHIAQLIPSLSMQISLLGGLFSYLTARVLCRRSGMEVAPIAKMKDFKLPLKVTTPVALLFAAATLAALFLDLSPTMQMICSLVMNSLSVVFAVQAVTLIHWFITLRSKRNGVTVTLSVLIPMVALLIGGNVLMWIGFFEMIFKLRYRVIARPTQPK